VAAKWLHVSPKGCSRLDNTARIGTTSSNAIPTESHAAGRKLTV